MLVVTFGFVFVILPSLTAVPDVKIPDVSGLTVVKAEEKLKKEGFLISVDTKIETSDTIAEGKVIGTSPGVGRTVKKGTTITIIESAGTSNYIVENLVGKNYLEVKGVLEKVNELYVLVERKTVDKVDEYRDKADIIIEQNPKEGTKLVKGDTITLYIPDIVETYPDMIAEGYTLADAEAFAEKYGIKLSITYEETEMKPEGTILSQGKPAGYTIVKGTTLKLTVAKSISVDPIEPLLPQE